VIVELSSRDELYNNRCNPYSQALLSAVPCRTRSWKRRRQRIILQAIAHRSTRERLPLSHALPIGAEHLQGSAPEWRDAAAALVGLHMVHRLSSRSIGKGV